MPLIRRVPLFVAAVLLAGACTDYADEPPPTAPPPNVPMTPAIVEAPEGSQTPRRLRRLNNAELENVLGDVLGARLPLTRGFLPDPRDEGYDNDAIALGISESKVDEIATAAERAATFIAAPQNLAGFAPCPAGQEPPACARAFLDRFLRRAWGRIASEQELARLVAVFEVGRQSEGYAAGIGLAAQAALQSPHFIYVTELGGEPRDGRVELTGFEIAAQLSLLLHGSRPDEALVEAAASGALTADDAREQHARRLLADPRARRQMAAFLRSWLGLTRPINKDLGIVPVFVPKVRTAVERELDTFLEHVLGASSGRLDELMLADYTFASPALLPIYEQDLLDPPGDFTRVRLHPRRRGLLSSSAFLATHALINQTNPVERGLLIRTRLLCQEIAPPPPDVLAQPPGGPATATTRQKYEAHVREPRCRACHQFMDPLGFGLEEFDLLGRFRTKEGDQPIDARGELTGTDVDGPFTGPAELATRLMASAQFRRCFVKQLWRFAEARAAGPADARELETLAGAFERGDRRIDELLVALVRKPTFITRKVSK